MRRDALSRVLVVVLAAFALGGVGTTSALADDIPDPITPPGVTAPPDDGENEVPPGPTFVITPGSEGDELGEPADQKQIDEAKKAITRGPGSGKAPTDTKKTPGATVAGPEAPAQAGTEQQVAALATPLDRWWMVGSGVLLLLVLVELVRAATRRLTRSTA